MSFNVARWRPAPLAPRTTGWGLWLAVLVLTLAGSGACIAGAAGLRAAIARWAGWEETVTVAAMANGLETADAAAARVQDLARSAPGVAGATVQPRRADDDLIATLMGASARGAETPRLVDLRLAPGARTHVSDLSTVFATQGLATRLDDHRDWGAPVERAALSAAVGWATLVIAVLALEAGLAVQAARLAVRRVAGRMALMHDLGAPRGLLAAQFPRPVAISAAAGAVLGAILAATLAYWAAEGAARPLAATFAFDVWDLLAAAPWPLVAGMIAWVYARMGAGDALKRMV